MPPSASTEILDSIDRKIDAKIDLHPIAKFIKYLVKYQQCFENARDFAEKTKIQGKKEGHFARKFRI